MLSYSYKGHALGLGVGILCFLFFFQPAPVPAQLLNDTFDIGSPPTRGNDAADPADAAWWSAQNTPTLTVSNDSSGIGSGNALFVNTGNGGNGNQIFANQFGTFSLGPNVGDSLQLSFTFRFFNIVTAPGTLFRFGIYNDKGTTVTGDNQKPLTDNDTGYMAEIGFGTTSSAGVQDETGLQGSIFSGNDINNLTTSSNGIAINDFLAHTAQFTLTRALSNDVNLTLTIDGVVDAQGQDVSLILTNFNELAFLNDTKELDYVLDNVSLSSAPEPCAVTLLGLGAAAWFYRHYRSHRKIMLPAAGFGSSRPDPLKSQPSLRPALGTRNHQLE